MCQKLILLIIGQSILKIAEGDRLLERIIVILPVPLFPVVSGIFSRYSSSGSDYLQNHQILYFFYFVKFTLLSHIEKFFEKPNTEVSLSALSTTYYFQ